MTSDPLSAPAAAITTAAVAGIDGRVVSYDWPFPRAQAGRIEACWDRLRVDKPGLFDGRVLMSRAPRLVDGRLSCDAFVTGYKPFLCWRELGYPAGDEAVVNLFAMPALRSADGAFMLGRMSAGTANAGRLYFPAGTPEPADAGSDGRIDFEANILRELAEETGLTAADVALDPGWTIVFAGPLVACMRVARSPLPADPLRAKVAAFIAAQSDPELDDLHAVASPADFDPVRMPAFMVHYLRGVLTRGP